VSGAYSASEDRTISEREVIEVNPGRISGVRETVLGATSVGERIFLCDGRSSDTRDDTGIYRTSI
jgi:hypothetical protein